MPFFMVDDGFHASVKTQRLIDMGQVGVAAVGLWTIAGSQSQQQLGDGQVEPGAWRLLGDRRLFAKLAKLLVEVGLWEQRDGDSGGFEYHDWADIGYAPGVKVKATRKRTKELKNPDIVNAVRARDGDNCRYCGRRVNWKDRKGDAGGTYDHVIPGLARGVTNLVVACFGCNRKKAQRTPEQAGMTLLPPKHGPDAPGSDQISGPGSGPGPDSDQIAGQISGVPHRTRSRTRSRSGTDEVTDEVDDEVTDEVTAGPAGRAPSIEPSPGHTGSPWHNHRGPPPDVDSATCPTHGLDVPCRKCTADHYAQESR